MEALEERGGQHSVGGGGGEQASPFPMRSGACVPMHFPLALQSVMQLLSAGVSWHRAGENDNSQEGDKVACS